MPGKNNKEDELVAYKDHIRKIRDYSSKQFDQLLVYLSGGALVLTLGFAKDIVKITESTNKSLLVIAWSLFALSLILILFSHKSAIKSMDLELDNKTETSNTFDIVTEILNYSSLASLFTGIIVFVIFVIKNI